MNGDSLLPDDAASHYTAKKSHILHRRIVTMHHLPVNAKLLRISYLEAKLLML